MALGGLVQILNCFALINTGSLGSFRQLETPPLGLNSGARRFAHAGKASKHRDRRSRIQGGRPLLPASGTNLHLGGCV
jgi:hypothetical protein